MLNVKIKLPADKPLEYPILIGEHLLQNAEEHIKRYTQAQRFLIVTNTTVYNLYGSSLNIKNSHWIVLPDGEKYKDFENLQKILNKALEIKLERKDAIIAFGGGVIGDIAGFAASIYQRGIDFIQIPTTLLAQVDSSVGGKVAVNHKLGKNMIGSFYQPKIVIADISVLNTLPLRQLKTGLAEIVKYAFIEDTCACNEKYNLIDFLEKNHSNIMKLLPETLTNLIEICVNLKASVVSQDEKEKGLRAILNFGHTYAHAIEKVTDYEKYTHGEAVAIGMKMVFTLAKEKAMIPDDYFKRALNLINLYDFDMIIDKVLTSENIYEAMKLDKKVDSQKIRFVMPIAEKKVKIFNDIEENLIKKVVSQEL